MTQYIDINKIPEKENRSGKWKTELEKIPEGKALTLNQKDGKNAIHALYGYQKKGLFKNYKAKQRKQKDGETVIYITNPKQNEKKQSEG